MGDEEGLLVVGEAGREDALALAVPESTLH